MRVMFDVVHPAHVHFYRVLHRRLVSEGHACRVVARDKDVTLRLLDAYGIEYETLGRPSPRRFGQAAELVRRDWAMVRIARQFRPDVVLARNPSGMHAARLTRATGIFDTDNGTSGGFVYRLAAPFADVITTPACTTEDLGPKQMRYPSYKALAFLHPNHFTPDRSIVDELGLGDSRYAILRLVAGDSAHDHAYRGLSEELADAIIATLEPTIRVYVSVESDRPTKHSHRALPLAPERIHDAMAFASLVIGDSGSMVGEAAVLGTPAIYCGSFADRLEYLVDMQRRGLVQSFREHERAAVLEAVGHIVDDPSLANEVQRRRTEMLAENVDLSSWYYDLVTLAADAGPQAVFTRQRRTRLGS